MPQFHRHLTKTRPPARPPPLAGSRCAATHGALFVDDLGCAGNWNRARLPVGDRCSVPRSAAHAGRRAPPR